MDLQATQLITASQAALQQLSALAVQYAFSILGAIILLIVGWSIANFLKRVSYTAMLHIRGFDETLARFLSNVLHYSVLILVVVTALGQFGVQTASIIATLGAAGLAIGLALQGTLQNIAAGIMLLVLRPFRVGEYIDTGSINGTIVEIGLFATQLRTPDGVYRLAPNSTLWNVPITNYSREKTRRNDLTVGISYEDDIDQAFEALREIAKDPRVLANPSVDVFVTALADSSVNITLRYWTAASDYWAVNWDFIRKIKLDFDRKGINIAYPQLTLHTKLPVAANDGSDAAAKSGNKQDKVGGVKMASESQKAE
ncbi:mechanosensitive ion channel [Allorhizobium sp. BGMRC 0089]|uniref:mechanosensitive ion channel family protein n=1 Tax=Allorhizobium sonneratiae TaxID=2934936 RepID=UPI002034098C|nr:mechanosensitive ion channel domain-containing protein [Allorhizobium sonneratiae]MCM2291991.1 mechanosensitive ion channel [Allorhizobium sonneratiae]